MKCREMIAYCDFHFSATEFMHNISTIYDTMQSSVPMITTESCNTVKQLAYLRTVIEEVLEQLPPLIQVCMKYQNLLDMPLKFKDQHLLLTIANHMQNINMLFYKQMHLCCVQGQLTNPNSMTLPYYCWNILQSAGRNNQPLGLGKT